MFSPAAAFGTPADALGNWVTCAMPPASQTQTNVSSAGVPLMAVALLVKYSGTVRVECAVNYGTTVTAKTVHHALTLYRYAPPIVGRFALAGSGTINTSNIGFGRNVGANPALATNVSWAASLSNDAAGLPANSFSFGGHILSGNGGAAFSQKVTENTVESLTGELSATAPGQFSLAFSGMQPNFELVTPNEQFPIGNTLVAVLQLISTAGGDLVNYQTASLTIQEQPLP